MTTLIVTLVSVIIFVISVWMLKTSLTDIEEGEKEIVSDEYKDNSACGKR